MLILQLVIALASVVLLGRLLGRVLALVGQPPVIGEMTAGIALGPSVLGWVAPGLYSGIFDESVVGALGIVAQVGIALYMFRVGLELNLEKLRARLPVVLAVSLASVLLPLASGAVLGIYLYPRFSPGNVPLGVFALFIAVAMSVTAFPVLASILNERGLAGTSFGTIALAAAATSDACAWVLLAIVLGVAEREPAQALGVLVLTAGFVGAMGTVVRPLALETLRCLGRWSREWPGVVAALGMMSVAAGNHRDHRRPLHPGAFAMGAVLATDSRLGAAVVARTRTVTSICLPAFFALAGLRTDLQSLAVGDAWTACVLNHGGGVGEQAGWNGRCRVGLPWSEAAGLGVLMNTRGLMEMIVLNIGLDRGILSPQLFTMFVLMTLTTTAAAAPLLGLTVGEGAAQRWDDSSLT